ncbi:nucleoside hydrolase-like domain-containing protein [Rhodobacter sp. NSM]|uniref:nucleoside hydrolase-like domain-containing protein n=1 Tax=Rhodobacter sp. NSM TaxID=3457501 RepID=UPI003FD03E22
MLRNLMAAGLDPHLAQAIKHAKRQADAETMNKDDLCGKQCPMNLPRVSISSDRNMGCVEKDDAPALIRALFYRDKMDIVGISATASKWGIQDGRAGDVRGIIDTCESDQSKLQAKSDKFKDAGELRDNSWQGATSVAPKAGYLKATVGSQAII